MATYERLTGAISLATNTPGVPTGYGVQAKLLMDRLKRHGLDVAALSNYGLEGRRDVIQTKYGPVKLPVGYPDSRNSPPREKSS